MADILFNLRKDPANALKQIKPTNPILKDVFLAIPEAERRGVIMPDRGHALRLWLEQWATERQQRSHGEFDESALQIPIPSVPAVPTQTLESPSARIQRLQPQQQFHSQSQAQSSSQQFQRSPSPSDPTYDDDGSQIPAFQIQQPSKAYLSPGSASPSGEAPHAHEASSTGASPGGRCLSCRKKDLTIKKLSALIANLLEQVDDLALEARGDLTLIMSAAAAQQ